MSPYKDKDIRKAVNREMVRRFRARKAKERAREEYRSAGEIPDAVRDPGFGWLDVVYDIFKDKDLDIDWDPDDFSFGEACYRNADKISAKYVVEAFDCPAQQLYLGRPGGHWRVIDVDPARKHFRLRLRRGRRPDRAAEAALIRSLIEQGWDVIDQAWEIVVTRYPEEEADEEEAA